MPGNVKIQWGYKTGGSDRTVTFPKPFSNTPYVSVIFVSDPDNLGIGAYIKPSSITNSKVQFIFQWVSPGTSGRDISEPWYWMAIGL